MDLMEIFDYSYMIDHTAEGIFNVIFSVLTIYAMLKYYKYKVGGENDGDKL